MPIRAWTIACRTLFFVTVLKSSRFHHLTPETERFRNDAFSTGYTFETVFESLRFHQCFRSFLVRLFACASTWTPRYRDFVVFPSSKICSTAKQKLYLKSLDISKQRCTVFRRTGGVFRGNSRITSDCRVCSMLKTLRGCSMLADSELFGVRLLLTTNYGDTN